MPKIICDTLFVFDIETVPDLESARNLLGMKKASDARVEQAIEKYHLELTGGKSSFLRHPFHKIVEISFLEASIQNPETNNETYTLKDLRSGGAEDADEKMLLEGLFDHLRRRKVRLVSYNGRGFDIPVLKYRAMRYGISVPWLRSGTMDYDGRYNLDLHCDLLEAFSNFGASERVKMNEVCALFDIGGKLSTEGSMVYDLYKAKKIQDIREYCQLDVVNTYLIYLRYMLFRGRLNKQSFDKCAGDLKSFMEENKYGNSQFKTYIKSSKFELFEEELKKVEEQKVCANDAISTIPPIDEIPEHILEDNPEPLSQISESDNSTKEAI